MINKTFFVLRWPPDPRNFNPSSRLEMPNGQKSGSRTILYGDCRMVDWKDPRPLGKPGGPPQST